MRVISKEGTRGSLKWIQRLINNHPELIDAELMSAGALPTGVTVRWVSPLEDDDWAEYRDGAFLERIGLSRLQPALREFWPARGPQWDALGVAGDDVYLVEAKAHRNEMSSDGSASAEASVELIHRSLDATKAAMGVTGGVDWYSGHYQLANRLAHLHFLRQRGVKAHLVFVYFTEDEDMSGPASKGAWADAIGAAWRHLGLPTNESVPDVTELFIDVRGL